MNRLDRLWGRIVTFISVLSQTVRTLSALLMILIALGLGSVVLGYVSNVLPLIITGIAVFILSALLSIVLYTFVIEVRKAAPASPDSSIYPPPRTAEIESDIELLLKEIVYQHSPDGQAMRLYKRFKIRALQDGIMSFPDRYRWTGTGKCTLRSLTPGFVVANERKVEFWDYFDVQFPHSLRKGQEVDFTIEWDLFDEGKTAVPFLSTMIDFETKHLLMRVVLPPELAPKRAYCYEFAAYIDTLPIAAEETEWEPATQTISYEVREPRKYHKYLIRWYSE